MPLDDVTDLSQLYDQRSWDRVVGIGKVPPEQDINHPDNAEVVARLRAEQVMRAAPRAKA